MAALNLSTLSAEQLREVLASVDNIYCDNDGVLSVVGTLLPGVRDCINQLQAAGKNFKIVTNNTAFGCHILSGLFRKQGVNCPPDDIITPTQAIIKYLREIKFEGKIWMNAFGAMPGELKKAGFDVTDSEDPRFVNLDTAVEYLLKEDPDIKAIIVDITLNMTVGCIVKAVEYLKKNPEILLIFGGMDASMPMSADKHYIGSLYFQNMIMEHSKREPLIFGKPSDNLGRYLLESLDCDPSRTLFIGDTLDSDIGFARKLGFNQLLVLSGVSRVEELHSCDLELRPDYYVSSMDELNSLLCKYSVL